MHRGSTDADRRKLDARAYRLREQGLTYEAIAERLGESLSAAWRRVRRHERELQRQAEAASHTQRSRE